MTTKPPGSRCRRRRAGLDGGILSAELTKAGLKVVALERGPMRGADDYAIPHSRDELTHVHRHALMQNTRRDTLTVRNNVKQEALPMRRLGSFLPGEGVGGSGVHWSGVTWRWTDMEFKVRSMYEERYGKDFIPADMTIQDWGITYAELEPYYDRFEYTAAVSGKAGNLKGVIQPGGNPFEGPRARDYALPPLTRSMRARCSRRRPRQGYHPFPIPCANASQAYTNPDGQRFGACQYCGFCQRFRLRGERQGQPARSGDPGGDAQPNFELRTNSWVTRSSRIRRQARHRRAVHQSPNGEEFEQPAGIVILAAYA
jgi:gluconate 2-dehydrogenase alpha chain